MSKLYDINELTELQLVAESFKARVRAGDLIYLLGDLGAGKTTFTRYFLRACGVEMPVKSPTYTLYETYQVGSSQYIHMDLYRLSDPEELYFLGIEELINSHNVMLVEWPQKGAGVMPAANWLLEFKLDQLNRTLTITSEN